MKLLSLRWIFLAAAAAGAARCAIFGLTPGSAASAAVFGLAWFALSRRKVHSLDRAVLGLPPRA
jgi:hypothetical protein